MSFTSSYPRPRLLQNVLLSRIVALIIKVLYTGDISSGFNSTFVTSSASFFISDTIQFLGFESILSIACVSLSVSVIASTASSSPRDGPLMKCCNEIMKCRYFQISLKLSLSFCYWRNCSYLSGYISLFGILIMIQSWTRLLLNQASLFQDR